MAASMVGAGAVFSGSAVTVFMRQKFEARRKNPARRSENSVVSRA
jgi:hypothetical protein